MLKIINDIHADPARVGGTTDVSREALQVYAVDQFRHLLSSCGDADFLIILGDLFNKAKVDNWVFIQVLEALEAFTEDHHGCEVILVRGNHDSKSEKRQDICSLEMLGRLLGDKITLVFKDVYNFEDGGKSHRIVPHMFNQEEFDLALTRVDNTVDFLYIHANIDNAFATGDHSLNVSQEQIKTLHDRGVTVICGHEHQHRQPFPNVHVIGNQFPTSIADCKGNAVKHMLTIDHGIINRNITWAANGNFLDVPIEQLDSAPDTHQFVRVSGAMSKADFPRAILAIDKFRKRSNAFVVSNAIDVIVDGVVVSADEVTGINVMELLIQAVPEKFRERVVRCLPGK